MIAFIPWYLAILVVGWLAFPLAHRVLRFLPDRGYALSKPLGLVLWGFVFWLAASLHLIQNDGGGILLSLLILGGVAFLVSRKGRWREILDWLRQNLGVVITSEALFLAAFALWAVVRAVNPDALGTEKPMELAFINAILHSPVFPPHDPWLSGYAISYYYFGYVIVAMLCRLTGLAGSIGFNLGIASWFGLTAVAAYGLLYNLLASRAARPDEPDKEARPLNGIFLWALLAPLFLLLVSNANGLLEVMHARGLFWQQTSSGQQVSQFWQWMDIQELTNPPQPPLDGRPNRPGGIWWWRSSRVLTDYDVNGGMREVIDEFPAFTYLLGDLHPHVLSLPFAMLAVGLALNLYLRGQRGGLDEMRPSAWLKQAEFWLAAVVLGGLAFLNTWDFPIYVVLFACAFAFVRVQQRGWRWERLIEFASLALELGFAGVLLYVPFYIGFSSQAGGLLPSLAFFTRGIHFWVMFLPLLLPILIWVIGSWPQEGGRRLIWKGFGLAAAVIAGLWVLSYLYGLYMFRTPSLTGLLQSIQADPDPAKIIRLSLDNRFAKPGMWLSMLCILTFVFGLVIHEGVPPREAITEAPPDPPEEPKPAGSRGFVILMVLVGCGLVLLPEFFYLRDQFGWRMNTIFKFYFQAWMLWSIAAGYASVWLWQEMKGWLRYLIQPVWALLVIISLIYPYYGLYGAFEPYLAPISPGNSPTIDNWSLDGARYMRQFDPTNQQAIDWLRDAPQGVLVESVGGSYTDYARVSELSGQSGLLGWPGHESQWRGGGKEIGSREGDIEKLYSTSDWKIAQEIILRYNIRYIYIGPKERNKYHVDETKFQGRLTPAFKNDSVVIYEVPDLDP